MTSREQEDKLFKAYGVKYAQNDFPGALEKLKKLHEITVIKAFVSSLIVDVYIQMGMSSEAYESARQGVTYPNPPSKLYKQYAELLVSHPAADVDKLSEGLDSIEKAIQIYNNDSVNEDIEERFKDTETFKYWFDDKTRTRTEMTSLRSDIKSLIYSLNIYKNVQKIEENISKEKQKTIELMALFTAIIALIFSNVQVMSQQREIVDVVIVNLSLLVALTWILWLVGRISSGEALLPLNRQSLGRTLGFIVGTFIAILIIGILIIATIHVYSWIAVKII